MNLLNVFYNKIRCLVIFALLISYEMITASAQPSGSVIDSIKNPIIPGFYPDPSICRVGDDYYVVNSSFEYFPGVPIFHSKDLVHWEQIGYCLTRPSQLNLAKAECSRGVWAPTIRYNKGLFYMVVGNVSNGGNIIVTAKDPAGEWSDPVKVDQGWWCDPDLFFDDDGKVYFCNPGNGIIISQIDPATGKKIVASKTIWYGTEKGGAEGPHIYKIKGYYYLLVAEGGTEYGHAISIARSKNIWGPYESCPRNPILSNMGLWYQNTPQCTGHGDLVEDQNGNWWVVFLGVRNSQLFLQHLGRETYLVPVTWDKDGWPVVNGDGHASFIVKGPFLPSKPVKQIPAKDDFDTSKLGLQWNFIRNPRSEDWSLTKKQGWLSLRCAPESIKDTSSMAFIGRRQQYFNFEVITLVDFQAKTPNEEAGLMVEMNNLHHYEIAVSKDAKGPCILVRYNLGNMSTVIFREQIAAGMVKLKISGDKNFYYFSYALSDGKFKEVSKMGTKYISAEVVVGFTGTYLGMYATGNGVKSENFAAFDWFSFVNTKPELE